MSECWILKSEMYQLGLQLPWVTILFQTKRFPRHFLLCKRAHKQAQAFPSVKSRFQALERCSRAKLALATHSIRACQFCKLIQLQTSMNHSHLILTTPWVLSCTTSLSGFAVNSVTMVSLHYKQTRHFSLTEIKETLVLCNEKHRPILEWLKTVQ